MECRGGQDYIRVGLMESKEGDAEVEEETSGRVEGQIGGQAHADDEACSC